MHGANANKWFGAVCTMQAVGVSMRVRGILFDRGLRWSRGCGGFRSSILSASSAKSAV